MYQNLYKLYIIGFFAAIGAKNALALDSIDQLLGNINRVIINPLLMFLFAAAILLFLSGMLQMFLPERLRGMYPGGATPEKGKAHMQWGILGLFIMFGVFGIMKFIAATMGSVLP